jgi:hypothetical protein
MTSMRITLLSLLLTALMTGCDKDERNAACQEFRNALKAEDKEKVKEIIDTYIIQSASLTHTSENLQRLATFISESCDVQATVFCYACIDTLPGQSEIIIRFMDGASQLVKIIDLSNAHDDDKMKFMNVHGG